MNAQNFFSIYLLFQCYIFRRFAAADLLENDCLAQMKRSGMHHCTYSFISNEQNQIVFYYDSCLTVTIIRELKYMRNGHDFCYINLGLILANVFQTVSFNSSKICGKILFLYQCVHLSLKITQNDLTITGKSKQQNDRKIWNHDFSAMQHP